MRKLWITGRHLCACLRIVRKQDTMLERESRMTHVRQSICMMSLQRVGLLLLHARYCGLAGDWN